VKKFILFVLVLVVVVAGTFFAISAVSWPKSSGDQVVMQFYTFHPGTLTVTVGTTVTWTDKDWLRAHNVIGEGWSSNNMNYGDTFAYTFSQAGTFTYRCSHHPWMKGTVIVK
jgi:plastocyanin